jgi:hypothetical protein
MPTGKLALRGWLFIEVKEVSELTNKTKLRIYHD